MDDYINYDGGYHDQNAVLSDQAAAQAYMQPPVSHLSDATGAIIYNPLPLPGSCDVKPRLNKMQHDFLESEFQKLQKPTTGTKKEFALKLNVTLDKVNNWFQNRRAKNKHDSKKMTAQYNLYNSNTTSDTEPSPFQPSSDYAAMMQHFGQEGLASNGIGIATQPQQLHDMAPPSMADSAFLQDANAPHQIPHFSWEFSPAAGTHLYDESADMNRRTLTQENFAAIGRDGGMVNGQGQFEGLQSGFAGDQDMMNQVFGNPSGQQVKEQDLCFPYPVGAPLSSSDSTIPSVVSDQSYQFPMSHAMQNQANAPVSDSDWTDSRSSSLSMLQQQGMIGADLTASQSQPAPSSTQWQPGSSVPIDPRKQWEDFAQASQSRAGEPPAYEQPLAFPSDTAFARRPSQATMLAHSMGSVNIHTPQPHQQGVFKAPAPVGIAARRQRPRPANLGVAALRSASYSGAGQPGSPGHGVPQTHLQHEQQPRRIKSAMNINGAVAHGRIMKSTPGSAQRSPVNWTFANGMVSPGLARQMSQGNLAPPTPMSPHEQYEQMMQQQQIANMTQQPSISENDSEQRLPYQPSASVPPRNFSSPPHTPLYPEQQSLVVQRMNSHIMLENTPPQSAPAGQTCFPSNMFASAPQQHVQQPTHFHSNSVHGQMQAAPVMQHPPPPPQPTAIPAEQPQSQQPQSQQQLPVFAPTVTFAPSQQSNVTTGPPPGIPLQFANGIPTMTAEGTVKMSFPPQAQLMQQQSSRMGTPPQQQYAFVTTSGGSPSTMSATGTPQQRGELFVHEYSPPDAMKRTATPRKAVDAAPKNYTFNNSGAVDFLEKSRAKKTGENGREGSVSTSGWSPASSSGTASTS